MATKKRLIDADALLIEYCQSNGCNEVIDEICPNCFTAGLIESAPTVDAVEVVRCKDCKHYMTIHCTCDGCCISDNWYCADGERRTDG